MKWARRASLTCIGNMAQCLLTPPLTVFEHMALDEILARGGSTLPVLRFYQWTPGPSVTFGYSQFARSVQAQVKPEQGPLCRRPTGGGMVFHGEDLTFSLIFQSDLSRPKEIYAQLHGAIEKALLEQAALPSARQGAVPAATYAPQTQGKASGCFVNPVEDDLLADGQKILGGAIRRFGEIVLYQGSLQCSSARSNPLLRRAVMAGAEQFLEVKFVVSPAAQEMLKQARQLAVQQYQTLDWTEKFV